MATATLSQAKPQPPVAAMPAPAPDDEELRKSMEQEAAELEPEVEPKEEEDAVSVRLLGAAQEVTREIEECDKIIEEADAAAKAAHEKVDSEYAETVAKAKSRRDELKGQFQAALNKMQKAYGLPVKVQAPRKIAPVAAKPKARASNGKGQSIRVLILGYLEKHRSAKTHEIRSYLQAQGRTTNPGVELTRMVKSGAIINKERGLYTIGKHK